jgi:hypothetical protein
MLLKPGQEQIFPQNLCLISLLFTTGKLFEKVILKIVQRHIEERGLLNASQFGLHADHSTTLQCMRLTGRVALNFNSNMPMAAVFLDIEKAFDTTWHLGMLYKLSKLKFLINLIKLISSFRSQRKFRVSIEGEMSTPRDVQVGVSQGSFLFPLLYRERERELACMRAICPKHLVSLLVPLLMTPVYMRQTAKRVMFSESCSEVSLQLRCCVNTGT